MWKREFDTESTCITEAKEYTKKRYDQMHKELDFMKGEQVLIFTLRLINLRGHKNFRDSFVGPFTIISLIGKNAVKVKITKEFPNKHPVLPVSLVNPHHQTGEDRFPSRKKDKLHKP
ncbi:hypothetical protein O181_031161 [Austropuccinia psidii MF-1]|uniref:Uncharacterized protein n=1 Tax=Austropuccinia psidii MF-1 TaxID=1389203 RepID=A0A9Q3CUB2_9BASI|nr:hypothetical protein [Austropuccinia psidii MF-1]